MRKISGLYSHPCSSFCFTGSVSCSGFHSKAAEIEWWNSALPQPLERVGSRIPASASARRGEGRITCVTLAGGLSQEIIGVSEMNSVFLLSTCLLDKQRVVNFFQPGNSSTLHLPAGSHSRRQGRTTRLDRSRVEPEPRSPSRGGARIWAAHWFLIGVADSVGLLGQK